MCLLLKHLSLVLVLSGASSPASALSCVWPDPVAPTRDMSESDWERLSFQSLVDWLFPLGHAEVIVQGVFTPVYGDRPFQHQLEHAARQHRTAGTYPPEHEVEA